MGDIISLGLWIKRRRKALDLTQNELAQRVGCSLETIRKVEADARRPSREIAALLAEHLGLVADERAAFIKAVRAELAADQLQPPAQTIGRGAFVPAVTAPSTPTATPATPLPSGTITFLFTDIEGSTRLWEQHPRAMPAALARHDALLKEIVTAHGGVVFKTVGDSALAAFAHAPHALVAALAAQRAISAAAWELPEPPRVRMALHTGGAESRDGDYFGPALNRAARLLYVGHGGQVLLSLATEQLVREHLPPNVALRDLGTHRLKDLSLPEQIFQITAPDLPANFPALNTLDARHTNLPSQPTTLLGREQEVATLVALLRRADTRLVTLTGPGGVGKTRLGFQVTAELIEDFAHGVYFIDLAPIREARLVTSAIAITLGVREIGGQPLLETLQGYLREKRMLLLLDNFEQVLDAAPLVAELLAAAPQLKVLVTSREILHLRGEKEVPVAPLALPDPAQLAPLEQLSQYAAVALFIARALDARADFQVNNSNAPAVIEICAQLDGLPLAIELAAARLKLFAPEALLARLSDRLALLTGGPRDLPARQQTIRNTIAWSHDLLSDAEQTLFRRLGVFVGGCTLEAAEAVCTDKETRGQGDEETEQEPAYSLSPDLLVSLSVLDGLTALVDKSLLRRIEAPDSTPRFIMLETIREYALEKLQASGEEEQLRRQHALYYLTLVEQADAELHGRQQNFWLDQLETEHDNLGGSLMWSISSGAADIATRLAAGQGLFWFRRGHWSEGRGWLERVWKLCEMQPPAIRAKVLLGLAHVEQSDPATMASLLQQSLALYREAEDKHGVAFALFTLAWVVDTTKQQEQLFEESLALYQALDDQWGIAAALHGLGDQAIREGDYEHGAALCADSLALRQKIGDIGGIAWSLSSLAMATANLGDFSRANTLFAESITVFKALSDMDGLARTTESFAEAVLSQGDYARAATLYAESLAFRRELGEPARIAWMLERLGWLARERGDAATAWGHLGESLAIFRELDDAAAIAGTLNTLAGIAILEEDPRRADELLAESLAIGRRSGPDPFRVGWTLNHLGHAAQLRGNYERAIELHQESLAYFDENYPIGLLWAYHGLGETALGLGHLDEGASWLAQALAVSRTMSDQAGIAWCLAGLGSVSALGRDAERAARLWGAAERLRQTIGCRLAPAARATYERAMATARAQLGEEAFAAAWAVGCAMSLKQAIAKALEETANPDYAAQSRG